MQIRSRMLVSALALGSLIAIPSVGAADNYDVGDSDHPVRYYSYYLHARGKVYEYFVTRPIHWAVSQPKARYVFGHVSYPRVEDYWGDFDLYQRYNY